MSSLKKIKMNTEERVKKGVDLFMKGYNCAQSVAMAFSDIYGLDEELLSRLAASFGGGIGRMRETCGSACGMFLLAGLETGKTLEHPYPSATLKRENYELVQHLAEEFRKTNGSLLCRELLGGTASTAPKPDERTAHYYATRPCARMVESAIRIYCSIL